MPHYYIIIALHNDSYVVVFFEVSLSIRRKFSLENSQRVNQSGQKHIN